MQMCTFWEMEGKCLVFYWYRLKWGLQLSTEHVNTPLLAQTEDKCFSSLVLRLAGRLCYCVKCSSEWKYVVPVLEWLFTISEKLILWQVTFWSMSIQASQMYMLLLYRELLGGLVEYLQHLYCKNKSAVTWLQLYSRPLCSCQRGLSA